jgi:hypothetical protein
MCRTIAVIAVAGVELVDGTIGVAQDEDFTNAEHGSGGSQFRFTHAADLSRFSLSV